jgi:hypothetical protein
MDLREIGWGTGIHLAEDGGQLWALVNKVMNHQVS